MKRTMPLLFVAALLALAALPARVEAQSVSGLWDAAVVVNGGIEIPFRFEIAGIGPTIKGSFFNGDEKVTSTSGTFENGALTLSFDEYGTEGRGHAQGRPARGPVHRAARAARRIRSRPNGSRRSPVGDANDPVDRGPVEHPGREELERRIGVAADRAAVGRRSVGGDSARRRRHRHADRHLSRRQVRAQPLLGRASAAARADARQRRHAVGRAEQGQPADRGARGAGARQGAAASRAIRRASPA